MVARDRHADRTKDGRDWDTYERGGGRDRDTKQQGRAVSPLRRQSARDEKRERERELKGLQNHESLIKMREMSKVPSDKFRPFRSRSPRGSGGHEQVFVRHAATQLRHGCCSKERGNGREDRDADRTKDGRDWDKYERGGGRDRDTKQQGRAVSPLRRQSARDEEREREREREREMEREIDRERERELKGLQNHESLIKMREMSKVPSDKFRSFRSRSPRGSGGHEQVFVRHAATQLRHGCCSKERGNGREDRERRQNQGWEGLGHI
jgi:hypothetical protein